MRPWRLKILALCLEHPKGHQNPKFTPLSETTSIAVFFIWESLPSPPPPPRAYYLSRKQIAFREGRRNFSLFYSNKKAISIDGATCQIKSHMTLNLIYMIQCNRCHLQYIGETKRLLKDRFNEHRRSFD